METDGRPNMAPPLNNEFSTDLDSILDNMDPAEYEEMQKTIKATGHYEVYVRLNRPELSEEDLCHLMADVTREELLVKNLIWKDHLDEEMLKVEPTWQPWYTLKKDED